MKRNLKLTTARAAFGGSRANGSESGWLRPQFRNALHNEFVACLCHYEAVAGVESLVRRTLHDLRAKSAQPDQVLRDPFLTETGLASFAEQLVELLDATVLHLMRARQALVGGVRDAGHRQDRGTASMADVLAMLNLVAERNQVVWRATASRQALAQQDQSARADVLNAAQLALNGAHCDRYLAVIRLERAIEEWLGQPTRASRRKPRSIDAIVDDLARERILLPQGQCARDLAAEALRRATPASVKAWAHAVEDVARSLVLMAPPAVKRRTTTTPQTRDRTKRSGRPRA